MKEILKRIGRYILKGVPTYNVTAQIQLRESSSLLKDKKIIITGGTRGLGFAMAQCFISNGASVLISGRDKDKLSESASKLNCKYLHFDIKDITNAKEFISKADALLGGADCLVNNAGISLHEESFLTVTEDQFNSQFDTNLKGHYFVTQAFINLKLSSKEKASILFVSSERGETVEVLPYGLTKAALNSLIKGLAARYIQSGIRVNGIAPGVTASDMTGFKMDENLYCDYNITKRVYLPQEVAEIASFLLSDLSLPINGQIIVTNEGKTLNV